MTKLLYLDFDGVLHPDRVYLNQERRPELHGEGNLFMWEPRLCEVLAPYPEVKVVLATSWVTRLGLDRVMAFLSESVRARVIGTSAPARRRYGDAPVRAFEVQRHVRETLPDSYVIVDDDAWDWDAASRERLVLCNPDRGLGDAAAYECLKDLLTRYMR